MWWSKTPQRAFQRFSARPTGVLWNPTDRPQGGREQLPSVMRRRYVCRTLALSPFPINSLLHFLNFHSFILPLQKFPFAASIHRSVASSGRFTFLFFIFYSIKFSLHYSFLTGTILHLAGTGYRITVLYYILYSIKFSLHNSIFAVTICCLAACGDWKQ